jgi:hypothetical protein
VLVYFDKTTEVSMLDVGGVKTIIESLEVKPIFDQGGNAGFVVDDRFYTLNDDSKYLVKITISSENTEHNDLFSNVFKGIGRDLGLTTDGNPKFELDPEDLNPKLFKKLYPDTYNLYVEVEVQGGSNSIKHKYYPLNFTVRDAGENQVEKNYLKIPIPKIVVDSIETGIKKIVDIYGDGRFKDMDMETYISKYFKFYRLKTDIEGVESKGDLFGLYEKAVYVVDDGANIYLRSDIKVGDRVYIEIDDGDGGFKYDYAIVVIDSGDMVQWSGDI